MEKLYPHWLFSKKLHSEGEGGMLILTLPFQPCPLRRSIWNNIDIPETNRTPYNGYSLTKASGFLPSLVTAQKQQMQVQLPRQLASSLPYAQKLVEQLGNARVLLNKRPGDPK